MGGRETARLARTIIARFLGTAERGWPRRIRILMKPTEEIHLGAGALAMRVEARRWRQHRRIRARLSRLYTVVTGRNRDAGREKKKKRRELKMMSRISG